MNWYWMVFNFDLFLMRGIIFFGSSRYGIMEKNVFGN